MASYVVLARKWRPAQFSDIVGQGPVVRTLMNAIRAERIHQAYLLTGSRGIGKTSIARIFAKVVRCEHTRWEDPWLRCCDECSSCKEIAQGNSVDVIEIDGASNNGVDAVREIRENAKYLPAAGSRKIYIIDEVHMLTTAAFNALLKTLEEPPAHVIFVFATTEPHKIPATILSRCQRFDLRRVTIAQIQTRLAEVTSSEGLEVEPAAIGLLAQAAEGSMRDALSLLDQVVAFAGSKITTQAVRESIGLIEGQCLLGVLRGIFAHKPQDALALVDQAYQQGHDLKVFARSLIELLHACILAKIGSTTPANEYPAEEWKELQAIAALRPLEEIELFFQVFHHGMDWIARSARPKIVLDVLLVKCATAEALAPLAATSSTAPTPKAAGNRPSAAPTPGSAPTPAPAKSFSPAPAVSAAPAFSAAQPVKTTPAPTPTPVTPAATPAAPAAAVQATATGPHSWEGFISHVRETRPLLATLLEHGVCEQPPSASNPVLCIFFSPDESYFRDQISSKLYAEQLLTLARDYFGVTRMELKVETKQIVESMAFRMERDRVAREQAARKAVQNHPIISEARSLFGGELGPIEIDENDREDSDANT